MYIPLMPASPIKKSLGFNLIEIMVAIVIIAVLAAIGTNYYFSQIRKSRITTAQSYLQELSSYMEQQYRDRKAYPSTIPDAYLSLPPQIVNDYNRPILALFDSNPPSYRIFLNVISTGPLMGRFNSSVSPYSLNLAIDSDYHRWFERTKCDCSQAETDACGYNVATELNWEDFAQSLAASNNTTAWTLATKTYVNGATPSNSTKTCKEF